MALALTLTLTLTLTLALTLALTLPLALTLALAGALSGLLALPLALTLLTLLTLLALLALPGSIGQVASGRLQVGRGAGQVAIEINLLLPALECLTESVQRLTGRLCVAGLDCSNGIAQRGLCIGARLSGSAVHLRQLAGKRVTLLVRHLGQAVLEVVEILVCLLWVALRIAVAAGRGATQRT